MSDSKNIRDFNPEESWLKAEQMLDTHFRKKRIFIWSLSLFVIALAVVSTTMIMNRFDENVPSQNQNILPGQTAGKSADQKQDGTSAMVNHADEIKSSPKNVVHEVKRNEPGIENPERKSMGDKSLLITKGQLKNNEDNSHAVNTHRELIVNSKKLNHPAENTRAEISEEAVQPKSSGPADAMNNSIVEDGKNQNQQLLHTDPDLAHMRTIHTREVSFEMPGPFSVSDSRSENKNVRLPGKEHDLRLLVYASAQYVSKTLESKTYSDYVVRRKEEEVGIMTNSIGASVLCEVKKFSMSIGIEYSSWGEENRYVPYLIKKTGVENGSNQHYYRDVTDTLYISGNQYFHLYQVSDSMFVSHIDTVTKRMYDQQASSVNGVSKFYYLEVPVEFGYHITCNKLGIGATVGISPAWLVGEKGFYLTRDMSGVERLSEIKSTNKLMMNGRFSLDFYYRLNEQINLIARPQIRTSFGSVFQNDYDVNQRYYSTGLVVGILFSIK